MKQYIDYPIVYVKPGTRFGWRGILYKITNNRAYVEYENDVRQDYAISALIPPDKGRNGYEQIGYLQIELPKAKNAAFDAPYVVFDGLKMLDAFQTQTEAEEWASDFTSESGITCHVYSLACTFRRKRPEVERISSC